MDVSTKLEPAITKNPKGIEKKLLLKTSE